MSIQIRSYGTATIWLLPMLILLSVGPSGNNKDFNEPDFKVPSTWQNYERYNQNGGWGQLSPDSSPQVQVPDIKTLFKQLDDLERAENKDENPGKPLYPGSTQTNTHSKSLPVRSETEILKHDYYHDMDMEQMKAAGVGEFEQVSSFEQTNDWDRKPSDCQSQVLAKVLRKKADWRPSGGPTKPGPTTTTTLFSSKTTAVILPSTFCLPDSTPFSPPTTKCPASSAPKTTPTTDKPSTTSTPTTKKVPCGPKSSKKSEHLTPKTAKMVLDIILATKQHVLSVLKTLNYLEMEVLSHSPDDCPLENYGPRQSQPKKKSYKQKVKQPKSAMKKNTQTFFGIQHANEADMALAREEEHKLKSRVWEEHQQEMRHMSPSKSGRFQIAPQAPAQLEPAQEA